MNKLTIPAILVATVMVAGAFAFMPVQQATTVHTTITNNIATLTIGTTAFNDVAANADFGNLNQNNADVFAAADDNIAADFALVGQGRVTVTQAATDDAACDIFATVTDDESGAVLVNDIQIITGAALNDVGFFSINLGNVLVDSFSIAIDADGDAGDDCDNVGLDLDTSFKVLTTG